MSTKTKIALAAAVVFSVTSGVRANEWEDRGGGPTQTWQDIEQSRLYIQKEIEREYHTDNSDKAYGYVAPTSQTQRPSHEQSKKR
jgi:hypothetical protein